MNRRHGLHRPEDAAAHAARSREALSAFLADAPGPGLIISGEDIGMLGEAGIHRMLAAFRPLVDRIVAVGMVRPPRSFITSAIQQRIRGGAQLAEGDEGGVLPHYRARFAPFLDAPEVAETRLHLYTPATLHQGCSVATFLRLIDAPESLYPQLEVVRANSGASRLGVVLAMAANEAVPVFLPDGRANPDRAPRLVRFLDSLPGARFVPPASLVAPRLARAADDIAWMEARLGAPFDASETQAAPPGAPETDPRSLDWDETRDLMRAVNALLHELAQARNPNRPPRAAMGEDQRQPPQARPPAPTPEQEARRAARRAQRRQEGRQAWR